MNNILFTIAIPTYNNEKIIRDAITSCINQDNSISYEILIINNASSDKTGEIIDSFNDAKIRVVNNPKTVSIVENHNIALNKAAGKYIIFCHSDDKLENNALKVFAKKVAERDYPERYVLWGNSMFRDFSANYIKQVGFLYNQIVVGEYAPLGMMYGGLPPSGTCYSKDSFLELGGFLNVSTLAGPFDYASMIYLAMKGFKFEMTDELLLWRVGASTSLSGKSGKVQKEFLEVVDDSFSYFLDKVSEEEVHRLIILSNGVKLKPWLFYYSILQKKVHARQIKRIVILELIKNPLLLRDVFVRKTISRLYNSWH